MKKRSIAIIIFQLALTQLALSTSVFAGMAKTFRIEGVVDSIRYDEITLWVRGKLIKVKRETIPHHFKVFPGKKVEAYVPASTVLNLSKK